MTSPAKPAAPERLTASHTHAHQDVRGMAYHVVNLQDLDGVVPRPVGGLVIPVKVQARTPEGASSLAAEIVRRYNAEPELRAALQRLVDAVHGESAQDEYQLSDETAAAWSHASGLLRQADGRRG